MKKAIGIYLILQFISLGIFAQQLSDGWRLTKKIWISPNEGNAEWIYSYDATGKISAIKYYQGKKLHSIKKGFVYNNQSLISSYKESFADGADTIQLLFSYDDKNRILSITEVEFKKSGKRTNDTRTFTYTKNEIKESKIKSSFGGKLIDEITYSIDDKGNMVRKTSIQDGKKTADYIYGEYDNKPNPLIFTGAYFYTELLSKQNSKEGYWENDKPAKTIFTYTPSGMLQNAAVTYMLDNRGYTHRYRYTYAKLNFSITP